MPRDQREVRERALRSAVLAGDDDAWQALYRDHAPLLAGYVAMRTRHDRSRTDDLVQEAWSTAVRRIRSFDPARAPFLAWLRGIADGLLRNEQRRRHRERARSEPADLDLIAEQEVNPMDALTADEQMTAALGALPDRYRSVLQWRYAQQRSVAEIAAEWSCSTKAVESALTRARAAFRDAWTRWGSSE